MNVFDFVNDISHEKNYIFTDEVSGDYSIYLVNKAFSYYVDTIYLINEINKYPSISKKMHFDYLFNTVRSRKRFATWNKYVENEDLDLISEYYNCNIHKAKQILRLLTKQDLTEITNYLDVGGISNVSPNIERY